MEWVVQRKDIEDEILKIERSFINSIVVCHKVITYCQNILETYRKAVRETDFPDEASEISFFKQHKQIPLSYIIQYTIRLEFELDFQKLASGMDHDFIIKKMEDINRFFSMHQDFVVYMSLEHDGLDAYYFTRKHKSVHSYTHLQGFRFDPDFSTSHDLLLGTMTANRQFQEFLQRKLSFLAIDSQGIETKPAQLHWTGSTIALTELAMSLKHSGVINEGNTSLKAIIMVLQNLFGKDLGDYNHTASRIKNRSKPTKFTDRLRQSLLNHFRYLDD